MLENIPTTWLLALEYCTCFFKGSWDEHVFVQQCGAATDTVSFLLLFSHHPVSANLH